ncbi:MAG: shikimate dehydrogenase [archaeon]|jgi:shikimate dehydrogenase|nr:shikimate dehydrogenase [archaeon]
MLDSKTKLISLLGHPVEHSIGPAMHNAAFKETGLNFVYLAFDTTHLNTALAAMKGLNFRGFSVTIPHKQKIVELLDRVDPLAAKILAVNTVVNENGVLVGYNTDSDAAINALKGKISLSGKKVALLGAGGASRAIAFGLQQEKALTTIFNRTFEKAKSLAKAVGCEYSQFEKLESFKPEIIINATSVGMSPKSASSPVDKRVLKNKPLVFDVVYTPLETVLLKQAKTAGCETVSGLEMFLEQGAEQFKLWTGQDAPRELMREVVERELAK